MRINRENEASVPVWWLRHLLAYDRETGVLMWKIDRGRTAKAGGVAGCLHHGGYIYVCVDGASFLAHRIVWAIIKGAWPKNEIDHINQDRTDNRISNLREVTHQDNSKNSKMQSNNTSGATGVYWKPRNKKWCPMIRVNGILLSLGSFDSFEDAVAARKAAEKLYGFHENHGKKRSPYNDRPFSS